MSNASHHNGRDHSDDPTWPGGTWLPEPPVGPNDPTQPLHPDAAPTFIAEPDEPTWPPAVELERAWRQHMNNQAEQPSWWDIAKSKFVHWWRTRFGAIVDGFGDQSDR